MNFNWKYQYEIKVYFNFKKKKYIFILKRPGNENRFCTNEHLRAQTVVFKCVFTERNQEKKLISPEGKADLRCKAENARDELERPVTQTARETSTTTGAGSKHSGANWKKFSGAKGRTLRSSVTIITAIEIETSQIHFNL